MAIDPTELAQEQEQRQRVDVVGAPTEFAKGPEREGVEVAGLGELFKIVGPQVLDVITKIDSSVSKPIVDTKKIKNWNKAISSRCSSKSANTARAWFS